jgi:RNA polymerase sigma-70 factor (ECF subfamily)
LPEVGLQTRNTGSPDTQQSGRCFEGAAGLSGQQHSQGLPQLGAVFGLAHRFLGALNEFWVDLSWSCHEDNLPLLVSSCKRNRISRLLPAFRAGDRTAGDALLRHFEPWLRLLAQVQVESRFRAKFDPSDVVQQTMLEAVRALPQFRGTTEAELTAWLRQILAHALAHEIRRYRGTQKRDLQREVPLDKQLTNASQRLGDILPATGTSPSQVLIQHERQVLLAQALERLPEDYREVIVLRSLEGLSHDEVAKRLGRNSGAVRMLWVRALARLRQEIERVSPTDSADKQTA